ncbi:amidohydrolase family protein [Nesterenkonia haasae]|uniref:amidohydrolase family protein n=1 Tax=Nesterenkonia haasae TaxID=2587813 RepID=UPI0013914EB2|nr:amidohydrolase family protein [Nesterenkonia haasae]NDK31976.1 amidohydrolase [Nesterenkonia haasae]
MSENNDRGPGSVIDATVHHHWASQLEVTDHMSAGWREQLGIPNTLPGGAGAMHILPATPYRRPGGDYLPETTSSPTAPPASDPEFTAKQVFESGQVSRAILGFDRGMFIPSVPNAYRAVALARAMNDWTIDHWLASDDRFYGLVMVPNQTPLEAAEEIRRAGLNDRMVGVLLAANGLNKPFGHPAYHPIYEAAAEMDLPIVFHAGGDQSSDTLTHPTAGGMPSTYAEIAALSYSPMMTHVQSMIVQGVLEKYPSLRIFVSGVGVGWIPGLFFRLDVNWRGLRREVPWVRKLPSEYFRESFRISSWPFDKAPGEDGPERVVRALEAFGGVDKLMCFASGFPSWNTDSISDIASRIPASWHNSVFKDNAEEWFRWPGKERAAVVEPTVEVGEIPETGELGDPNRRTYETEDGREVEWVPAGD